MTRRVFVHCNGSLRSLRPLDRMVPGHDRYAERALLLAAPGDAVCVPAPVDPDYLDYLAGLGLGPRPEDVIVAGDVRGGGWAPLVERLRAHPRVFGPALRGGGEPPDISIEPFAASAEIYALAAALRCESGATVRVNGGPAELTEYADQKHRMRARAQELGIPVADGEVAELAHPGGRRRGDLAPVRTAIERQVARTGRVVVRGALGAAGSSAFVVGRGGDDTEGLVRRLAQRTDNRVYLVESMVEATVSPNVQLFIPAGGGAIGPAAITDQRWGSALAHTGNQLPSSARLADAMEGWARILAGWLRGEGYVGMVGFDFVEYRDPRTEAPRAFLAEVNPRVNGCTYPLAVRERLAPGAAFVSGMVRTAAQDFAEVHSALGGLLFDPERGTGVLPYSTGLLDFGRCSLVALAGSRLRAAELYGAAQARLEAAWAPA